jgi:hypothetical protein
MQPEHVERAMYYFIPRFDLEVAGATPDSYVAGTLEDWIPGALRFDGKDMVATLTQAEMVRDTVYPGKNGNERIDGAKRKTPDMQANSFLIEAVLRTSAAQGTLVAKMDGAGYRLELDGGRPCLHLSGATSATATGTAVLNDGAWHHLIAEVDRPAGQVRFYVDGTDAGASAIALGDASLANGADLVVGKSWAGELDFLRIARGTLADAKTTIAELYAWEFDGPFLRDFAGSKPVGKRDAGAIEGREP